MTTAEKKVFLQEVRKDLRVVKVTCTRTVKGRGGDTFVGFTASCEAPAGDDPSGMSLKKAKTAAHLLGVHADLTAFEHAVAGGLMTAADQEKAAQAVQYNYGKLMSELLGAEEGD